MKAYKTKVKDARISILFSHGGAEIQLHHGGIHTFAVAKLTPEQVTTAFSRLGYTNCDIDIYSLDTLNKTQEVDKLEFPLPDSLQGYSPDIELTYQEGLKHCPKGWVMDRYFGSQDSFFTKDGNRWARATIRRWVDDEKA